MTADGLKSPPPVSILGIGAVTALGRDVRTIARKLAEPAPGPAARFAVSDELFSDPVIGRTMRRADRFTKMAALAARDAWITSQSASDSVPMERVGLVIASGFGPHCRGFRFLDGILDSGDSEALPTDFSHSVHGAAAAYVAELLELRGPSLTITDFECGLEQAVLLAQCWLDQGTCDRVLAGVVEETGEVLLHCASRMLGGDNRFTPGEGAVFLTLARQGLAGLARVQTTAQPDKIDLLMMDVPAIPSLAAQKPTTQATRTTTFNPWFGHSAGSSGLHLLGGLLSMSAGHSSPVDNAATFKPRCDKRATSLVLTKT